jgi:hypothetical protein
MQKVAQQIIIAGCCFHSKQASQRQRSYMIAAECATRNAPTKNAHTRHSLDVSSTPNVALLACGCMGGGGCGPACMWAHNHPRHRKENKNHAGGENHFPRWLRKRKPLWYPEYFPHVGRHQARCLFSYLPEPAVRGGVQRCQCPKWLSAMLSSVMRGARTGLLTRIQANIHIHTAIFVFWWRCSV